MAEPVQAPSDDEGQRVYRVHMTLHDPAGRVVHEMLFLHRGGPPPTAEVAITEVTVTSSALPGVSEA